MKKIKITQDIVILDFSQDEKHIIETSIKIVIVAIWFDIYNRIGCDVDFLRDLLQKIHINKTDRNNDSSTIELNKGEILVIKNCLNEVSNGLWEKDLSIWMIAHKQKTKGLLRRMLEVERELWNEPLSGKEKKFPYDENLG